MISSPMFLACRGKKERIVLEQISPFVVRPCPYHRKNVPKYPSIVPDKLMCTAMFLSVYNVAASYVSCCIH